MNTTTTQKNTTKKIYGPVSELVISYGQEDEPIISYDQENNLVLSYCQTDNYYSVIGLIDDSVDTVTIPERIDNIPVKEINISRSSETSRKYSLIIPPTIERVNSLNEIVPGAGYNHLLYTLTNLIDYNGSKYLGTEKNPYMVLVKLDKNLNGEYIIHEDTKIIVRGSMPYEAENIIIPRGVEYIENGTTSYRTKINNLIVDDNNKHYYSEYNCIIKRDNNMLISGSYSSEIPDFVEIIDEYAFYGLLHEMGARKDSRFSYS